tara:strand:- start:683 stop:955 length:273 start_codon:yes stop_codon:yes gene_type:complete
MATFDELKAILQEEKEKHEFEQTVKKVYSKKPVNYNKLTQQVKKAAATTSSLECFKPENMYHSDKDTERFLENSPYMEAYNANRMADGDY